MLDCFMLCNGSAAEGGDAGCTAKLSAPGSPFIPAAFLVNLSPRSHFAIATGIQSLRYDQVALAGIRGVGGLDQLI